MELKREGIGVLDVGFMRDYWCGGRNGCERGGWGLWGLGGCESARWG